jgi:hypothetical protein
MYVETGRRVRLEVDATSSIETAREPGECHRTGHHAVEPSRRCLVRMDPSFLVVHGILIPPSSQTAAAHRQPDIGLVLVPAGVLHHIETGRREVPIIG